MVLVIEKVVVYVPVSDSTCVSVNIPLEDKLLVTDAVTSVDLVSDFVRCVFTIVRVTPWVLDDVFDPSRFVRELFLSKRLSDFDFVAAFVPVQWVAVCTADALNCSLAEGVLLSVTDTETVCAVV